MLKFTWTKLHLINVTFYFRLGMMVLEWWYNSIMVIEKLDYFLLSGRQYENK